ncbi:hypothetical protein HDU98_000614 [Podochytrium sp. JEL0797]|nr:hypothetical protein HDU98_000614 [Podochytrium sp. JEL0797]
MVKKDEDIQKSNRLATRFLSRNRRLVFLALTAVFLVCQFNGIIEFANTNVSSLSATSTPRSEKPRILYYNRHSACTNNMAYVTSRLGLNFTQMRPGFLGDLGMREHRANDLINDGFVKAICQGADIIIVSDTLPDARPLLQSLLRKNPSERCEANIVVELTNRFDWGVADFDEYHRLIWELTQAKPKNLYWVANNAFEAKVMADDCNANPEFRILRPSGYSDVEAKDVSPEQAKTALIRELDRSEVLGTMTWLKMPFTRVVGHYGGPKTLQKYKAYIEFPYQVSTMKLYENLAAGVVMLIPSAEFFQELVEKRIHAFGPWEMIRRMGSEWPKYMDYYAPELSPHMYYFNSWDHLHQLLQQPTLDTKHVRKSAPKAYKKIVTDMLHGWAELFEEMGYPVLVDGKPRTGASGIEKFTVPVRYAQPKNVEEWKHTYERIKAWKSFERDQQIKIWEEKEKALEGMEKKVKEMANAGNILEMMKLEAVKEIDVKQYRVLDFLNGEAEGAGGVFGGLLTSGAAFDAETSVADLVKSYESEGFKEFKQSDFFSFGHYTRYLRIFHTLTKQSLPQLESLQLPQKKLDKLVNSLTESLYPWLPSPGIKSINDLSTSFTQPRGIVFTFPNSGFPRGVHLILTLRTILHCTLPIEIFYNGDTDLSPEKRAQLSKLPGSSITFIDLHKRLPLVKDISGFNIKPFVMLASSFREVIFLDDDVTLFQNPDTIVSESQLYKTYGVLFFLDRSFSRGDSEWVRGFLTSPSVVAQRNRYMMNISRDEQESSLVVLDKGRLGVVHALLAACHMNLKEARDGALHKHTHGDKESFWMAHEMVRAPYDFVPGIGGAAGGFRTKEGIEEREVVCGPQSHIDEKGRLLHFNGLVLLHKDDPSKGYIDFHHYAAPVKNGPGNIDIGYHPWCVHTREPEKEVHPMSEEERRIVGEIVALHKKLVSTNFAIPKVEPAKAVSK